jgi:hypothetical protein
VGLPSALKETDDCAASRLQLTFTFPSRPLSPLFTDRPGLIVPIAASPFAEDAAPRQPRAVGGNRCQEGLRLACCWLWVSRA